MPRMWANWITTLLLVVLPVVLSLSVGVQAGGIGGGSNLEDLNVRHVLVPIVMEAEAAPFVEHLGLTPQPDLFPPHTPFLAYSGNHQQVKVTVITMGKDAVHGVDNAATVPASVATTLALQALKNVDLVVNAGTCGGFSRKQARIGDVVLTTHTAHHDRRIPIPGFQEYGIGKSEVMHSPVQMAKALQFRTGVCTTGNSLDWVERDDELMQENDATVKDMEAAAIHWVCDLYGVPYLGVKVVTDIVDGGIPTQDEFLENLASAAKSLQEALPRVLDYICQETKHEEL